MAEPPARRSPWLGLVIGAAALSAVVATAIAWGDHDRFVEILTRAEPAWLGVGLLLQAATYTMPAAGWWSVLRRAGRGAPPLGLYGLALVQLFTNQALPIGGLAGLVVVLDGMDRRGVPRPIGLAAMAVDQLGYLASYGLGIAATLAWYAHRGAASPLLVAAGGIAIVLGLAQAGGLLWLTTPDRTLPGWVGRSRRLMEWAHALLDADPALVRSPGLLARTTVLRGGNLALDAATAWVCLQAVGQPVPVADASAAFVVASLGRSLGLVPGGLGTYEGSAIGGLLLLGVPIEPALAATLLFRGLSFWLPMVPGLLLGGRLGRAGG